MIRLVSNADDFGISDSTNVAIVRSFEMGTISNTTIMVNMDSAENALELSRENGFFDRVGIHINLTAGEPLTDDIKKSSLFCNSDGNFNAAFHLSTRTRLKLPSEEMRYAEAEIEAQLLRYLDFGFTERHLDSHHHVHTDRPIWLIILRLAKKYGFRTARLGRNVYDNAAAFNRVYKAWFNTSVKKSGLGYTDYFGSFQDYKTMWEKLPANCIGEMMLHPLYSEDGVLMDSEIPMSEVESFLKDKKVTVEAISVK